VIFVLSKKRTKERRKGGLALFPTYPARDPHLTGKKKKGKQPILFLWRGGRLPVRGKAYSS